MILGAAASQLPPRAQVLAGPFPSSARDSSERADVEAVDGLDTLDKRRRAALGFFGPELNRQYSGPQSPSCSQVYDALQNVLDAHRLGREGNLTQRARVLRELN